jgi:hypothetical protein
MGSQEDAQLAYELSLTADLTRGLPGGKLDDSTYSQIEDALDRIGAPMKSEGRWLTLAERVAALRPTEPAQSRAEVLEFVREFDRLVEGIYESGEDGGDLAHDPNWGPVIKARASLAKPQDAEERR